MSNPDSFTAIKQHVTRRTNKGYATTLATFEHEGSLWATNAYWVTPALRVAPLLERFNLDTSVPGVYEVNSTVHKSNSATRAATMGRHLDPKLYTVPMVPVMVAGEQAYTRTGGGLFLAAYQTADGAFMGLAVDDLEWVSNTYNLPNEEHHYYGPVRYLTGEPGSEADGEPRKRAVAVIADLIHTVKPSSYGTGENGEQVHHPAETENLGARVVGIIAPLPLGNGK